MNYFSLSVQSLTYTHCLTNSHWENNLREYNLQTEVWNELPNCICTCKNEKQGMAWHEV